LAAVTLTLNARAVPTLPVMAPAATTGGATGVMTMLYTPWPLRPLTVSRATMVTAYLPAMGAAQLTTPVAAMLMPAGAPSTPLFEGC